MKPEFFLRHNLRFLLSTRLRFIAIVFLGVVLLTCLSCGGTNSENAGNKTDSIESDFDAAYTKANFPWYSSEEKSVVFLREPVKETETSRPRRARSLRSFRTASASQGGGFWGRVLTLWLPVAALVVLFGVLVLFFVKQYKTQSLRRRVREEELRRRRRRIETLAAEARNRYDDLDKAAEEALACGDLRSALIFYFSWILVEMDRRDVVLMDKGKTNLEYWRELEDFPRLRDLYHAVMVDFDRVYFGGLAISREAFDKTWSLRETFKQLMFEEDERKKRLLREHEEAQRQADFRKWEDNAVMSVLIFVLGASLLLTGCKQVFWSKRYVDPVEAANVKSMNDVSVFADYCSRQAPDRVYPLNSRKANQEGDFDRCDTIVWFCSPDLFASSTGFWNLASPREQDELMNYDGVLNGGNTWFDDSGEESEDSDDSKKLRDARLRAWKACLERYASADEEDWTNFYVPFSNAVFYRLPQDWRKRTLDELKKDSCQQKIRNWLKGKAGRKCIVVLSDQNSERDYWRAAREYVERNFDEPLRSKYLDECKRRLDGTLTSSNVGSGVSTPEYSVLPDVFNNVNRTTLRKRTEDARKLLELTPLVGDVSSPEDFLNQVSEIKNKLEGDVLPSEKKRELEALLSQDPDLQESVERLTSDFENGQTDSDDMESVDDADDTDITFDENNFSENQSRNVVLRSALLSLFPSGGYFTNEDFRRSGVDLGDDYESDSPTYRPELWFRQVFVKWSNDELPHEEAFSGDSSWTKDLPEKALFREKFRLIPVEGTETLLALGDTSLVCQRKVDDGTVIFVNSTSFLSNYGLIDSTNRIIARRLIQKFNPEGRIGFLTADDFNYHEVNSGARNKKYVHKKPYGRFTLAKFSPFTVFVWHAVVLAMLAGFCAWPIYGRARRVDRDKTSDFAMHVDATAFLLKRSDSVSWAREQIDACRKFRKRGRAWRGSDEPESETPASGDDAQSAAGGSQ